MRHSPVRASRRSRRIVSQRPCDTRRSPIRSLAHGKGAAIAIDPSIFLSPLGFPRLARHAPRGSSIA